MKRILFLALILISFTAACADNERAGVQSTPRIGEGAQKPQEAPEASEEPPPSQELGTAPDAPLPAGVEVGIGEWAVRIGEANTNATDIVMAENSFNEPPAEGNTFVMATVTFTYQGETSGAPYSGLTFYLVDAAGNTHAEYDDPGCGVIPNELYDINEMFPGATAEGNVCMSVPADQLDGAVWMVEPAFSFSDERVFVDLS